MNNYRNNGLLYFSNNEPDDNLNFLLFKQTPLMDFPLMLTVEDG